MILDRLENAERYAGLHPGFAAAFAWLKSADVGKLEPGRHAIEAERLLVIIGHDEGRGRDRAKLEAHRRYIDIQLALTGRDEIGWRPAATCARVDMPLDVQRDIMFFADQPESWFALTPGSFAIFYPEDAHAPLAGSGEVRKAVFKVACDWNAG
jgi:biofilm protein TabA